MKELLQRGVKTRLFSPVQQHLLGIGGRMTEKSLVRAGNRQDTGKADFKAGCCHRGVI